ARDADDLLAASYLLWLDPGAGPVVHGDHLLGRALLRLQRLHHTATPGSRLEHGTNHRRLLAGAAPLRHRRAARGSLARPARASAADDGRVNRGHAAGLRLVACRERDRLLPDLGGPRAGHGRGAL